MQLIRFQHRCYHRGEAVVGASYAFGINIFFYRGGCPPYDPPYLDVTKQRLKIHLPTGDLTIAVNLS